MNEPIITFSDWLLLESKSKILDAISNSIGNALLYNSAMNYTPDSETMQKVYAALNTTLFHDKLPSADILCISETEVQKFCNDNYVGRQAKDVYALYVPIGHFDKTSTNENVKYIREHDYIIINTSNAPITAILAVNYLCHEMIHMYDVIYGNVMEYEFKFRAHHTSYESHSTNTFIEKSDVANRMGLTIMPYDGGLSLKQLCNLAVVRMNRMNETDLEIDPPWIKNPSLIKDEPLRWQDKQGHIQMAFI